MNTNTFVTFEQAKWLKEIGFNEKVHQYFEFIRNKSSKLDQTWKFVYSSFLVTDRDAAVFPDEGKNGCEVAAYSDRIYKDYNFANSDDFISRPEHHQVVDWFKDNHGIWISLNCDVYGKQWFATLNVCSQKTWEDEELRAKVSKAYHFIPECTSSSDAYSAAFDYIKDNIIQIM